MFAKTLIVFAVAAMTSEAKKLKNSNSPKSLVDVDVEGLSQAELNEFLE